MDRVTETSVNEFEGLYIFLDRRYTNLSMLLMYSDKLALAVGRECVSCPPVEGVKFIRLDNEDKYRSDIHTFVSHRFLEIRSDVYDTFNKFSQSFLRIMLSGLSTKEAFDECALLFGEEICTKARTMFKTALKMRGQSKLDILADVNIMLLREVVRISIANAVKKHNLLCVKFSELGYMCFKPADGGGTIVNAGDVVSNLNSLENLLRAVDVKYKIAKQGDPLYDKLIALNKLTHVCKHDKQLCDVLFKYYIPEDEYNEARILNLLCVNFGGTIVCPTSVPNQIVALDLYSLVNIF